MFALLVVICPFSFAYLCVSVLSISDPLLSGRALHQVAVASARLRERVLNPPPLPVYVYGGSSDEGGGFAIQPSVTPFQRLPQTELFTERHRAQLECTEAAAE